jgi:O-antigen ligase
MQAEAASQVSDALSSTRSYLRTAICGLLLGYAAVLPFKPLLVLERNGFLVLLGVLVLWCLLNRRLFYVRTPYDRILLALVVWIGLTLPFSVSPLYSLKEYGKLLQHMVVFYAVLYFLREDRYRRALFYVVGAVAMLVAGYGLTQFNLTEPQAVKSLFPSEVWFTTFLVLVFPFAFALPFGEGPRELKWLAAVACIMFATCLLFTQSRAGLLSFLVELWVGAWLLRSLNARIIAGIVTACAITAVLFAFKVDLNKGADPLSDVRASIPVQTRISSVIHRFDIWGFTLSEIAKHGLVGIGYGAHSYLLVYGQEEEVVTPGHAAVKRAGTHNIFLYLALHVGIPGMLLFVWLYYSLITRTIREYWAASHWLQKSILAGSAGSLIGFLCRLQFDQMLVGSLAVFFWVLLAMAVLQYSSSDTLARQTTAPS